MTFLEELAAHQATLDAAKTAAITKRVKARLNRHLRANSGRAGMLGTLSLFELAFLDLLHPVHYEPLVAVAKERIDSYFEGKQMVYIKLHEITLPKPDSQAWKLTFCESFNGPVVVFTMQGWKAEGVVLVG